MLVKIKARILICPGTDFHFLSTSVPPDTFLRLCTKRYDLWYRSTGGDAVYGKVTVGITFHWRPPIQALRTYGREMGIRLQLSWGMTLVTFNGTLARYVLWPVSVRLSVTRRYCVETDERIELVFGTDTTVGFSYNTREEGISWIRVFRPSLCCTLKLSHRQVDRRKCCQLSSTDDRHQFVTLSVELCVQQDGRDAAQRVRLRQLRLG